MKTESPWQALIGEVAATADLFDRSIRLWTDDYSRKGGKIFCGKGCNGCCSLAVNCTLTEAVAVARQLTEDQAERVSRRVAILREKINEFRNLPSFLRFHRKELGLCPLLETDGSCGVYTVRPLSCRSLLATKENRWCSVDFADVSSEEKRAFVESLDHSVAAFPMHYVAAMQELGGELETMTAQRMADETGFSVYGNLQALIWLERKHGATEAAATGIQAVTDLLEREGLLHPFLVTVSET